ncbi:MAG: hypothetical protein CMF52_04500 [Legionellales bacterium]|nr:hypothetical protein [Legionellales bacterium]HAV94002.1 hypothetical protein [Pseudomonadota bacterium]
MFKSNKQLILAATALLTGSQALAGAFSSTASITSNLLLSGVSISDDHPSAALATEYTFSNGITFSGKVQTVDFDSYAKAHYEISPSLSYTTNVLGGDVKLSGAFYNYPGDSTPDNWGELGAAFDLPLSGGTIGMGLKYTDDWIFGGETLTTLAHFKMPFGKSGVNATAFYVDTEDAVSAIGSENHWYGVEASYDYSVTDSLLATVSYTYADLDKAADNGYLVAKISYSF